MPLPSSIRKVLTSGFLVSLSLSLTPAVSFADESVKAESAPSFSELLTKQKLEQPDAGEKRYIVRYENDVNAESKSTELKRDGVEVKDTLSVSVEASIVEATSQQIDAVKKSEGVASVELDYPVTVTGETQLWGLDRVDQRSGLDGKYNYDEGSGVNVYVVDTGLNPDHVDFSGRIPAAWTGIHDGRGWADCAGHGTHVAGTVAGTTYGAAKKANIIPIRALDCNGEAWSSTVMAGIDWAVAHHQPGQPAVMNLSIGGFTGATFDQTVQSAVNDGITVVAAAGNSGIDACLRSPAKVSSAITVAATDLNDTQTSWSNYGSCVDVFAPGVNTRSAWHNAPTGYNTLSGTSMSTPHVAGAAAIMLARNPSLSPAQVHQAIIDNSTHGVVNGIRGATPNRMLFIPEAPKPAPVYAFTDIGGSGFINEITWMKEKGISTGFADGSYQPYAEINRDAMAAFMYRLAGSPAYNPPGVSPFTDINTNDQFYKEISWLSQSGITTGYPDGTFQPQGKVTREAMAAFMYRYNTSFCNLPGPVSDDGFTDINSTNFPAEVSWMKSAGISTGYADGSYRPYDNVTREAMAAFMNRLSNHIDNQGGCK